MGCSVTQFIPLLQVVLFIAIQILRLAAEYRFAPFAATSVEYLIAAINVGEQNQHLTRPEETIFSKT